MAMRRGVTVAVVVCALSASAAPKSVAIAAGDCKDAELLNGATAFSDAVSGLLKADSVDPAALLERLRPRPNAGLDDVVRQLDGAQSQFYSGQLDQAVEVTRSAIKTLERLPPSDAVAKQLVSARVLEGLILKALNKKTEQLEAWRRVLRLSPDYKLDPDFHTPAAIAQFDQLKKELSKLKKVPLSVSSIPSGATVFVDGLKVGKTPLKDTALLPGDYKVTITTGDTQSFIYDVKLDSKPVELAIDLAFERTVRPQLPLCVNGSGEADALKLASRAGAEQALVLRVGGDPGWVSAVLFDVARGARMREGGMKVADARKGNGYRDLASFVLTGQPAKLALSGSRPPEPEPVAPAAPPAPAPAPEPVAEAAPPPPQEPARVEAAAPSPGGGVPRFVPLAIAGVGAVVAVSGLIYFASGSGDRSALASALDANGNVINPADADAALFLDQKVSSNRTTSVVLGVTGLAIAATGAVLFFVLAPSKEAVQPTALVTPNGVYAGVTGSF